MKQNKIKKIKIAFFRKSGKFPTGIYVHQEPNIWYPAVYFRKSKAVDLKIYNIILEYMYNLFWDTRGLKIKS